jgi:hypothetical protein
MPGSLGLPVGTEMHREAVKFAKEHPVRAFTDPLLFYSAIGVALWIYERGKRVRQEESQKK